MTDVVLSVEDLNVHYGSIHAVKGISFQVKRGEIVTLIGSNGAGKSSTLNAIMNIVPKSKGKVVFNGIDITNLPTNEIVKLGLTLVPEGRKIFPNLTVYENLMMGCYARKDKNKIREDLDWVLNLFPRLKERLKQLGGTLSGGEQQMLALARGLMSRPKVLMMDEPSLGLAPLLVAEVFQVIQQIRNEGVTILLVEQNAFAALKICDYGYVLETGRITLQDKGENLIKNEDVAKAYLGIS
ncbi:ABC transporter ATP-binding protein [Pseudothermotoga thermarum]|uniref:Amino acid/amide ABC transporter ATP-binding protein 2, HAAT family n=1 Tax=Pseudothermotoga thermarum DSM 5069 TaxID=688269 RepID=F7YXT6_9THEM|nr:ABC transporter ATP-binding protein [Pseudothermotoga thermarum]AEH50730.1 amino acid/amide ABC transporter ATP-binding protein 2, HAAT family [Pseudothermotoga thermarum DSM 5069]